MIEPTNFRAMLAHLGYQTDEQSVSDIMRRPFAEGAFEIAIDFSNELITYPEDQGFKVHQRQTCNFSAAEDAVVFECVHRLLDKGYHPGHIELEPQWKLGHGGKSGRADILVRDQQGNALLIIECKTAGREFDKAWKDTLEDGAQLISYVEQEKATQFICLYASEFDQKSNSIKIAQRIVSVKDNQKILDDLPKALSFQGATNAKERFRAWKETYRQEFTETGIFEDNIQAYQIGKSKYTLTDDTKPLAALDIKGAYHRFRTILRKHNVSRRENAFEVLVNLFVCKIVDELENPDDLKFYWKGIAYDNYYDLVDRLQSLYKTGMQRFLSQDIVYVSNEDIEKAFWPVKKKRSAVKEEIKRLFRELKFFKGLDFEFIKVFNQAYFDKNAKVLIEIIQMWQGLRLTGSNGQHQFLGDMFEYFLDNGVKQSEGQFFTPVPICKFIVSSLPLERLIAASHEPLKVIDYACGAGHFLTEYAAQLPPLLQTLKPQADARAWNAQIVGIEKEDRLAKVAKVSAFMYGYNDIRILDADALVRHAEVPEVCFDALIANPPFAVEDFLQTVPEEERERYTLLSTLNDLGNKNVQCFFLERAQQLLKPGGVLGVIVPSSILSNTDATHTATRQILLQFFDFVALVELGGNTFGKTGTNTVVLFLRRKAQKPEPATHYKNRAQDFFEEWAQEAQTGGGEYGDLDAVRAYCAHTGQEYDDYQTLLTGQPNDALLAAERFQDYKRAFDKLADIKKLIDSPRFKKQTPEVQAAQLRQLFLSFCRKHEQDKLYYFLLAYHNPTPVLLIKGPDENKAQQKFLGYEWSGAKGQEGIRYLGGDSVHDIVTPLFDPADRAHADKIASLVRQNFEEHPLNIPANLATYASTAQLVDLLEFGRLEFDAVLSLKPKGPVARSRWSMLSVSSLLQQVHGDKTKVEDAEIQPSGRVPVVTQGQDGLIDGYVDAATPITDLPLVVFGDHTCIFKFVDFPFVRGADGTQLLKTDPNVLLPKCFYYLLSTISIPNCDRYERHFKYLKDEKLPIPPRNIQEQIIKECDAVDSAVIQARTALEQTQRALHDLVNPIVDVPSDKLANLAARIADSLEPQQHSGLVHYIGLENIAGQSGELVGDVLTEYATIKSTKTCFKIGDVLYGKLRPNLNKVHLAQQDGICSTDIFVLRFATPELAKIYAHYLRSPHFNKQVLMTVSGQQLPRTSWKAMGEIMVPVIPDEMQSDLLKKIVTLEKSIAAAQATIAAAPAQKQAILKKYL